MEDLLPINSHDWWEQYFTDKWSAMGGPAQTRYFMRLAVEELPSTERYFLRRPGTEILDWGCAFGQGVEVLSEAFPEGRVSGLDYAEEAIREARHHYPQLEFIHSPDGDLPRDFDAVVTSNCLEHFEKPFEVALGHLRRCRSLYIVLVPFAEDPLDETHVTRFTAETFPERLGGFLKIHSAVLRTEERYWAGGQLFVLYASAEYVAKRKEQAAAAEEREKWDRVYERTELPPESATVERFNQEFADLVGDLLPDGGRVLEAGCGGASQGLAIARRKNFGVDLLDFSENALRVAAKRFADEGLETNVVLGDAMEVGEPGYDLVFNAGALEHLRREEQVEMLRGLASRSTRYVIALVPNQLCYWYWLWRIQTVSRGEWPYGKEMPPLSLRGVFESAGLTFLGQTILAQTWTEEFIHGLKGIDPELRELILEVHRSPLLPESQRGYLLVALGSKAPEESPLAAPWSANVEAGSHEQAELVSALSDALAAQVSAKQGAVDSERHLQKVRDVAASLLDRLGVATSAVVGLEDGGQAPVPFQQAAERLEHLIGENATLREAGDKLGATVEGLGRELEGTRAEAREVRAESARANQELADVQETLSDVKGELSRTQYELGVLRGDASGLLWNGLLRMRRVYGWFLPPGSRRHGFVRRVMRGIRHPLKAMSWVTKKTWKALGLRTPMNPYALAFDRYRRNYEAQLLGDLGRIRCASRAGLVSIVLPVYNGEAYIGESIESVLGQRYPDFELIVVNDGSTDGTPEILDRFAAADSRVRVVHQENRKLPRTLSRGFEEARGEFLTWTSADNLLKPDFLGEMVSCLQRHPTWDLIYANVDIIGERGAPLHDSDWFLGYQVPTGSEHVHLPTDPSELNVWPNNYVCAAFMYRPRVPYLIGDYSSCLFGLEDYDYWMRINAVLSLRHGDFLEPVYDYRFHENSLTARDDELGITRRRTGLMVFEEFRRDFQLHPSVWCITADPAHTALAERIREQLDRSKRHVFDQESLTRWRMATRWLPAVHLHLADPGRATAPPEKCLPEPFLNVLLVEGGSLPAEIDEGWDLALSLGSEEIPERVDGSWRGWLAAADLGSLLQAAETRAKTEQLRALERECHEPPSPGLDLSIIVCTYRRPELLARTVKALARQELEGPIAWELLVVNNEPDDTRVAETLEEMRVEHFADRPDSLRLIECPLPGLSFARNFGISEASGRVLSFLDDDSVPHPGWLQATFSAFATDPAPGVVGGQVLVTPPDPAPDWLESDWYIFWSHFAPPGEEYRVVQDWWELPYGANWSCLREAIVQAGGFRSGYGRKGKDFGGGEEIVAARIIQTLGYSVGVEPRSIVDHAVDPERFTMRDVKMTIRAAVNVSYQAIADLYKPGRHGLSKSVELLGTAGRDYLRANRPGDSRAERQRNRAYGWARLQVLRRQLADSASRWRRPRVTR